MRAKRSYAPWRRWARAAVGAWVILLLGDGPSRAGLQDDAPSRPEAASARPRPDAAAGRTQPDAESTRPKPDDCRTGHGEAVPCPVPIVHVDPREACANWRWIGVKEARRADEPCFPLDGWQVRHLFCPAEDSSLPEEPPRLAERLRPGETPRPGQELPGQGPDCDATTLPPGLRPYCLYQHPEAGTDLAALLRPARPAAPRLAAVGRDCAAVRPAGSDLARHYLPALSDQFLAQAGQPAPPPAGQPLRLGVIDTAPTDEERPEDGPWNSPHGFTLVRMARELLRCNPATAPGPGSCSPFRVTARLALAYLKFSPWSAAASVRDEVKGGYVGTIGELAEAIRGEVVAWRRTGEARLILNLSVGWRKEFGGLGEPAGQAVHAALRDAFCRGVVAVAAAGNRDWGPDGELHLGPLLPAAWEALAGPTVAECAAALGPGDPPPVDDGGPGSYRPLLHATAAVDARGAALPAARLRAEPRLTAFGDHGVVEIRRDGRPTGEPTAVLTGSSVSTLVVSATAAALWSQEPGLRPAGVGPQRLGLMDRLYGRARDLGRPATLCQGGRAPDQGGCPRPELKVRRVYLCAALDLPCRPRGGAAAPPGAGPGGVPAPEVLTLTLAGVPGFEDVRPIDARGLVHERAAAGCPPAALARVLGRATPGGERFRSASPRPPLFPCPLWQLPGVYAQPAVDPQPGSEPCPACGFGTGSPGTLLLEIDSLFEGRLSDAVLRVGDRLYRLDLDLRTTFPPKAVVENVPWEPGEPVLLSFVLDGERSATSAVLVVKRKDGP